MSVQITAKMVSDLRAQTGAGLMDCKKALAQTEGDVEAAITILRKKGIASAEKRSGRQASEGLIEQYIHLGGKVGVLVEINCETDFVAKNDDFKAFCKDICLQIAASKPVCISRDDVPSDIIEKEREIAAGAVEGKPADVVQKVVAGKLEKIYSQLCLLEQPFVKNPDKTVQELLTDTIAKLGENMVIRRFTRYQVGEE